MKPLLISSGEPAGIGPDICLNLAGHEVPLVVLGDKAVLAERAQQLGLAITFDDYQAHLPVNPKAQHLTVWSPFKPIKVHAGELNSANAQYMMELLTLATESCLSGAFSALVTAPVHKAVIHQAGFDFSGHTELLASLCGVKTVVMMLAAESLRVALVTTHLPLREVSDAITPLLLTDIIRCLHTALKEDFALLNPRIDVAGLNPHAGESGCLGEEEEFIIKPVLQDLQHEGIDVRGPFPADTMFTEKRARECDVFLAMYHDQGLPVLKYASFGHAVNVTLGLPIIRTSVDHGTALELAGSGKAEPDSLMAAVQMAYEIVLKRESKN